MVDKGSLGGEKVGKPKPEKDNTIEKPQPTTKRDEHGYPKDYK